MPPKARITEEMIITAAFEIARTEGAEEINVRSIAKRLGLFHAAGAVLLFNDKRSKESHLRKGRQVSFRVYHKYSGKHGQSYSRDRAELYPLCCRREAAFPLSLPIGRFSEKRSRRADRYGGAQPRDVGARSKHRGRRGAREGDLFVGVPDGSRIRKFARE